VVDMTRAAPLTVRLWTRSEYEKLVDLGAFDRDPVELIGGQLLVAEPQGAYHATAVGAADDALRAALPAGWIVRTQAPLALDDESAPEPDLAVVAGTRADYRAAHPARPALIIEVADTSLAFDRQQKGGLYARAGIRDYWIVDLVGRIVEVHRDPSPDASAPYGWRYRAVQRLAAPDVVAPLAVPAARIAVASLLP
jgi:Uma2 family endonuclease